MSLNIARPVFVIPESNKTSKGKTGGGKTPPSLISKNDQYEEHKKNRKKEVANLIDSISTGAKLGRTRLLPEDSQKVFFEIKIDDRKSSKTDYNHVKEFLEKDSIDLISHISGNKFIVSTEIQKLKNFKDNIDNLEFQSPGKRKQDKKSNVFSFIEKIDKISQSDILVNNESIQSKDEFLGYIFFHSSLSSTEIQIIFDKIQPSSTQTKSAKLIQTMAQKQAIYGSFEKEFIDEISTGDIQNPIRRIEPDIEFVLKQNLRLSRNFSNVVVNQPELDNTVAVVDSGITKNHPLFKDLLTGKEAFINSSEEENSHGTFVASRIVFGNDLEDSLESGQITAESKILDICVLGHKTEGQNVINALKQTIEKYPHIAVYNLSLGNPSQALDVYNGIRYQFTRDLDMMAKKYGVLFVVSAGNQDNFWDNNSDTYNQYPECVLNPSSTIIPPADGVNVITVGSLADIESTKSIAKKNEPSPFTRSGRIGGQLKPDLSHYGGNMDKYRNEAGIGVKGFSNDNKSLQEGVGTSYSAPLVSQISSKISAYLLQNQITDKHKNTDLTKALLIHSAKTPIIDKNTEFDKDDLERTVGYGIPNFDTAIECVEHRATFVFQGELTLQKTADKQRSNIHEIVFDIPKELKTEKRKVRLKATLVYSPPISTESQNNEYYESRIEMTCKHLNSNNNYGRSTRKAFKYSPIKQEINDFKPTQYSDGKWKARLSLTAQGESDNDGFSQPYSLVISIEDITQDNRPKANIYEIIKNNYPIYQNIQSVNKTKVKV
jgi:hypothetical protein